MRFRILPLTMAAILVLLLVKIMDIAGGGQRANDLFPRTAPRAIAADEANADTEDEAGGEEDEDGEDAATADDEAASPDPKDKRNFSQIEVGLLQSLAKRREELDARERSIDLRMNVLAATEARIDKKIEDLKSLKMEVEGLLDQHETQQDSNIRSLVKIYESMKPKQAAEIFNQMDMRILLEVVDRMKEKNAALILANMEPRKAKDLTIMLAEQKNIVRDTVPAN